MREAVAGIFESTSDKQSKEFYRARLTTCVFVSFLVTLPLSGITFPYILPDNLDHLYDGGWVRANRTMAVIGLIGVAAAIGLITSGVHWAVDKRRKNLVRVEEDTNEEICHLSNLVYPPKPLKTGLWLSILGLMAFGLSTLIKPDLFDKFAGNQLVSNTTKWIYCSNEMICVFKGGVALGEMTLIYGLMAVFTATLVGVLFYASRNLTQEQLRKFHEEGGTPFAYHIDASNVRHQHYGATALASFIVAASYCAILFHSALSCLLRFDQFDQAGLEAVAGVGLFGMAAAMGLVAGVIHYGINYCRDVKDRSDYSVQVAEDNEIPMEDKNTSINETTGLIGQDSEKASIYRIGNCHPVNLIYPSTPLKTGLWISTFGLALFGLAMLIQRDLFGQFAGTIPVNNDTGFTNCTGLNSTLIANATVCVSEVGHFFGKSTLIGAGLVAIAGVSTLFHYAGAKVTECCSQDQSVIPAIS